jgi:hypothetical protein
MNSWGVFHVLSRRRVGVKPHEPRDVTLGYVSAGGLVFFGQPESAYPRGLRFAG